VQHFHVCRHELSCKYTPILSSLDTSAVLADWWQPGQACSTLCVSVRWSVLLVAVVVDHVGVMPLMACNLVPAWASAVLALPWLFLFFLSWLFHFYVMTVVHYCRAPRCQLSIPAERQCAIQYGFWLLCRYFVRLSLPRVITQSRRGCNWWIMALCSPSGFTS